MPDGVSDTEAVLLSDILPTGFEIGVQYGQVKPGDVVAVIGAGPVGLAAVMTARLYGAVEVIAVDVDETRLDRAADFGATDGVNSSADDWKEQVLALTDGDGVDVAIEAVRRSPYLQHVHRARAARRPRRQRGRARPAGHARDERLWIQNITISMGLVNTNTLGMLLKLVAQRALPAHAFVTHEFTFDQVEDAYAVFGNAAEHDALKVLIHDGPRLLEAASDTETAQDRAEKVYIEGMDRFNHAGTAWN